jgi:hypothetical protein
MERPTLLAYDADGNIIATLDAIVAMDNEENVIGLVDFIATEESGAEMTNVWVVDGAKGSKVWPVRVAQEVYGYRVELVGPAGNKRLAALVHKVTGERRERGDAAIRQRR